LRDGQAERLGGLEIDDELECGRLLDREVGGLLALEDLAGVDADLAIGAGEAWTVADQTAGRDVLAPRIDCRDRVGCGEGNQPLAAVEI
jgi:hypothetical protein